MQTAQITSAVAGLLLIVIGFAQDPVFAAPKQNPSLPNNTDPTQPTSLAADPESACTQAGGKYLGDMKCRLPNGDIGQVLGGAEAGQAMREHESVTSIAAGTPKSWALATTAIMFEINGDQNDLLGGRYATAQNRGYDLELLSKWWSITSYSDLYNTLNWLQHQGHREHFEAVGQRIDAMSETQYHEALDSILVTESDRRQYKIVRRYHRAFGTKSIIAWDLVRYIALCRWAYAAGLMTEADAWQHIMPAAARLQQTFSSWKELEDNYLVGRKFWSPQQTDETGDEFQTTFRSLLIDPTSPWNTNAWNMQLGIDEPLSLKSANVRK